jgi:hypothetical protein
VNERRVLTGCGALACFGVHSGVWLVRGTPWEILWACTIAALLIGLGALALRPVLVAIGVSWLVYGNPLWFYHLVEGGEFLPTSLLTHGVALALGVWFLRKHAFPERTFARAWVLVLALLALTRAVTPSTANINVVHHVPPADPGSAASYALLALMLATALGVFYAVERVARRRTRS